MVKRVLFLNMGASLLLVVIIWIVEVIIYRLFSPDLSMSELFFFRDNPYGFTIHLLITIIVFIYGMVMSMNSLRFRKAREEIISQQEKYRLLTEHSNDVIWKMKRDGKFVYVSPSVVKLRGFTPEEVMEQSMEEVLTPASLKTLAELMGAINTVIKENPGKIPSTITELEQPCKNGKTVWTEASVKTVLDSSGNPDYFIGVSRDITERKQKELELRRSEEYYRLLAETTMDYILVHNLDGEVVFVNPSGLKATGYSLDEIIGKNIIELIPEERKLQIQEFAERRAGGDLNRFHYETDFITKTGERRPVEVSSAPILINRTPISIMVAARDISERKKAEKQSMEVQEKIKRINLELEEKVRDRTQKLKQANEELESFSYSVSHDLHAPLRHISTFSDLLQKSLDKNDMEKSQGYLKAISGSVTKMKDLINCLLQISRTGRSEIRRDSLEMKLLVEQIIKDITIDYPDKKVEWIIGDLGKVNADIRLMKQVWFNLISNALKFSGKDKDAIIEIGRKNTNGTSLWFIKDNGVGFDPRYQDKLFKVFQRLHSDEDFSGSGIGLATVKRIINKHNGRIWAESAPDKGATFYFSI